MDAVRKNMELVGGRWKKMTPEQPEIGKLQHDKASEY